jgi:hypothetical protein
MNRITFRLTPQLEPLVAERVRQGIHLSDIVRQALEMYFGLRPTPCPTSRTELSDSISQVSDDLSDKVSDTAAKLSDVMSDVSDMQARLVVLETLLAEHARSVGQSQTERPTCPTEPATAETPAEDLPKRKLPRPHGLPLETLQAIADERTQCEGLTLREFAQRLFDQGIYASTAKDGIRAPVNPGTLKGWLDRARQEGLL